MAGISCCRHCLSQSWKIHYKHTRMHMHTHLLTHICFHIALLGLCMPGPLQTGGLRAPPAVGRHSRTLPDGYHPLASHCLSAEPVCTNTGSGCEPSAAWSAGEKEIQQHSTCLARLCSPHSKALDASLHVLNCFISNWQSSLKTVLLLILTT